MDTLRPLRLHRALAAILAATLLAAPAALSGEHNDAGTGTDAGGTPSTALLLPGFGTFTGSMVEHKDVDWYRASGVVDAPHCVEARLPYPLLEPAVANLTLSSTRWAESLMTKEHGADLGLVVKAKRNPRLGLDPDRDGGPGPGAYEFTLAEYRATDLGSGDGATGTDAGGAGSTTEVVVPRPCFAGLIAVSLNDAVDSFKFDATANSSVTITYLHEGTQAVKLSLLTPGLEKRLTMKSGQMAIAHLDEGGVWHLLLELSTDSVLDPIELEMGTSTDIGYLLGLADMERPPGQSCRPYCILG